MLYHRKEERTFYVLHISPKLLFFFLSPSTFSFPLKIKKPYYNNIDLNQQRVKTASMLLILKIYCNEEMVITPLFLIAKEIGLIDNKEKEG